MNYNALSDADLADLLKSDDEAAFAAIYERFKWVLYLHAVKRCGNREEAMDIVQELFTSLWDKRAELNIRTHLSGYLYAAIRNRVIKLISHRQVVTAHIESMKNIVDQDTCLTDHRVRENSLSQIIEKEINELPEKMREIFIMSRKLHMSHKEIAEKLGIQESTVKRQVSNALNQLRIKLGLLAFIVFLIRY